MNEKELIARTIKYSKDLHELLLPEIFRIADNEPAEILVSVVFEITKRLMVSAVLTIHEERREEAVNIRVDDVFDDVKTVKEKISEVVEHPRELH